MRRSSAVALYKVSSGHGAGIHLAPMEGISPPMVMGGGDRTAYGTTHPWTSTSMDDGRTAPFQ